MGMCKYTPKAAWKLMSNYCVRANAICKKRRWGGEEEETGGARELEIGAEEKE